MNAALDQSDALLEAQIEETLQFALRENDESRQREAFAIMANLIAQRSDGQIERMEKAKRLR
jgi:hypothetical protein